MIPPQHSSSTPSSFCSINDIGVALLHDGHLREAADLFATSLKQIRRVMAASERSIASNVSSFQCINTEPQNKFHDVVVHECSSSGLLAIIPQPCTPPLNRNTGKSPLDDVAHDEDCDRDCSTTVVQNFMFSCPMSIPPNTSSDDISFDCLCFMMIYNLALSFDLLSRSKGDDKKQLLLSLSFYQLAYKVKENRNFEIPLVYVCGMLNNMARLNLMLGQKDAGLRCLDGLMSILMYQMTRNQAYGIGPDAQGNNEEIMYLEQFLNSALVAVGTASTTAEAA
jgi:hypothetical protein